MSKIENSKRHRSYWVVVPGDARGPVTDTDLILMAGAIIAIILILMVASNKGFEKRYQEITAVQSDMQQEIKAVQSQLDQIEQTVADWHGIN